MKYSMLKTFAAKYRTKVSKIKMRYVKNVDFTVPYVTKAGPKESVYYNKKIWRLMHELCKCFHWCQNSTRLHSLVISLEI